MNAMEITMLVIGLVLLLGMGVCYIVRKDYFKYSQLLIPILKALLTVLKAVGGFTNSSPALTIAAQVVSVAIEAAGEAEKLWLAGQLDKAARPAYAQEYIVNLLSKANIEVTENIQNIVQGAISLTCFLMPHYSEEVNKTKEV